MFEQRVARLEDDVKELRSDVNDLKVSMARVEGKLDAVLSRTPTAMQLWTMILSTWTAGAGIVFLMTRLLQP